LVCGLTEILGLLCYRNTKLGILHGELGINVSQLRKEKQV
jgi:hypothetical protein